MNKKAAYDMIYLASCALNDIPADKAAVEKMSLRDIYDMSVNHGLAAMIYIVLESLYKDELPESRLMMQWKECREKAVRKNILLDIERECLFDFCEKNSIWYLPLKGIVFKELYPKTCMREMSDNDILFDGKHQADIYKFFVSRGYKADSGKGAHDIYLKAPVYNYEMHRLLFIEYNSLVWENYYKNVKERLIKDNNNRFGYHFSDEDFYIYSIIHIYKHYSSGGTGMRSLTDCYIYFKNKGERLNWEYIESELDKLKVKEFEKSYRELCRKIFSDKGQSDGLLLSEQETTKMDYIINSGIYGTKKNDVYNKLKKIDSGKTRFPGKSKFKYVEERIFPGLPAIKAYYPFFYKHKMLLPFFYIKRAVVKGIKNRKRLWSELKIVLKS